MILSKKNKKFIEVYNNYYPLIFNIIISKVGNWDDSEDICQEVFVNFYKKFDEIENNRNWLIGAIKYCISNYYRAKGTANTDTILLDDVQNDLNLAFENEEKEIRLILKDAIESADVFTSEKERILFELIAHNKFTYENAAKQLGINRRQAEYLYGKIASRMLHYFKKKGISSIGDIL